MLQRPVLFMALSSGESGDVPFSSGIGRSFMNRRACHPLLLPFVPMVRALGKILGPEYEIVLHDVSNGEHTVVAMENAALTGRSSESPLTEFGSFLLRSEECRDLDFIANYASTGPDGRTLRSSVVFVRDEDGFLVGLLCVNQDTTRAHLLREWVETLTKMDPLPFACAPAERFAPGGDARLEELLGQVRPLFGKPLRFLSRKERELLLERLHELGFFSFKGAMDVLCRETGKSRFTLYAHLREVRRRGDRSL